MGSFEDGLDLIKLWGKVNLFDAKTKAPETELSGKTARG
jgi:hypothetical protein